MAFNGAIVTNHILQGCPELHFKMADEDLYNEFHKSELARFKEFEEKLKERRLGKQDTNRP
jgi:hypothetical protein